MIQPKVVINWKKKKKKLSLTTSIQEEIGRTTAIQQYYWLHLILCMIQQYYRLHLNQILGMLRHFCNSAMLLDRAISESNLGQLQKAHIRSLTSRYDRQAEVCRPEPKSG